MWVLWSQLATFKFYLKVPQASSTAASKVPAKNVRASHGTTPRTPNFAESCRVAVCASARNGMMLTPSYATYVSRGHLKRTQWRQAGAGDQRQCWFLTSHCTLAPLKMRERM